MKARFTLAEIQQQALAIVDRDGLAGLSMRSLAGALETGPMTLYNYVKGRGELEELVVGAVAARVDMPAPTDDWHADTRAAATALWRTVRAHPAAMPLVLTRRTSSPAGLAPAEGLASALARSGLDGADLLAAFRTVMAFVMGLAQAELAGPLAPEGAADAEAHRVGALTEGALPALFRLASIGAEYADEEFDRGLALVLMGIQQAVASARD
ncbi:TetR/AcrR family transcriptional regulator C-terminal domain-containing protein [Streptomyces sp. NPDC051217]|uniref:TetR/AcrR family transcriptional regulator C-terminal domain-containing protein n=1 Tax=Streptomyces sp. NPDC051217 TaxID=3365644 RepID=UPI0037A0C2AD